MLDYRIVRTRHCLVRTLATHYSLSRARSRLLSLNILINKMRHFDNKETKRQVNLKTVSSFPRTMNSTRQYAQTTVRREFYFYCETMKMFDEVVILYTCRSFRNGIKPCGKPRFKNFVRQINKQVFPKRWRVY